MVDCIEKLSKVAVKSPMLLMLLFADPFSVNGHPYSKLCIITAAMLLSNLQDDIFKQSAYVHTNGEIGWDLTMVFLWSHSWNKFVYLFYSILFTNVLTLKLML